jgi:hypothetical protein
VVYIALGLEVDVLVGYARLVVPGPLGDAVTVAGDPVEDDVGGEVAVSEMSVPVRLYEAAQAASESPWCC